MMDKTYKYTYKIRGMSIGTQPKDMVGWEERGGYEYEVITYGRKLTDEELFEYDLYQLEEGLIHEY